MAEGIVVKVGMVGDAGSGKTSLRRKFLAGNFGGVAHGHNPDDDEHLQYAEQSSNIGVNCVDKTVMVRGVPVTFSLWDLGSQRESLSMMPLVASDATAMLLVFDLSRLTSLSTSREWWRKLKAINKERIAAANRLQVRSISRTRTGAARSYHHSCVACRSHDGCTVDIHLGVAFRECQGSIQGRTRRTTCPRDHFPHRFRAEATWLGV